LSEECNPLLYKEGLGRFENISLIPHQPPLGKERIFPPLTKWFLLAYEPFYGMLIFHD
jgi:hypothetical protein